MLIEYIGKQYDNESSIKWYGFMKTVGAIKLVFNFNYLSVSFSTDFFA